MHHGYCMFALRHGKSLVSVLFKVSFYNLESGKRNIILLEKSPYEPCLSNKTDDALILHSSLHLFSVCGSLKLLYETQKGMKSK